MTTSSGGRKRSAHERLHIAMVAPPWYDIPPKAYGGIESMVADLTQGLRRRGHGNEQHFPMSHSFLRTGGETQTARGDVLFDEAL